jgi:fukutin
VCSGYFRECDLIAHSKDVDLGILASELRPELLGAFAERGFRLKHVFGQPNDSYELSFVYNDLKLDLFFFYPEGDTLWNGGTQAKTGLKFK